MTCFCLVSEAAGSGTGMPQVKLRAGDGEVAEVAGDVGLTLCRKSDYFAAFRGFSHIAAEEAEDFVLARLGLDEESRRTR